MQGSLVAPLIAAAGWLDMIAAALLLVAPFAALAVVVILLLGAYTGPERRPRPLLTLFLGLLGAIGGICIGHWLASLPRDSSDDPTFFYQIGGALLGGILGVLLTRLGFTLLRFLRSSR
jgi:hypothetical protein